MVRTFFFFSFSFVRSPGRKMESLGGRVGDAGGHIKDVESSKQ